MHFANRPIIGYYGVIDERIDMELLEATSKLLPNATFIMIGPLAKVSEEDLAIGENIHYLGMKNYTLLPNYLKQFDIAMMPFAMNESTQFISPTKTLEYMAAYKPIISTPVYDVVRDYSHCVHIVSTAMEFRNAVVNIMDTNDKKDLVSSFDTVLEKTSWEYTVQKMMELIN
jgi:glycosyltransferase involved in cell wall biosynthesis